VSREITVEIKHNSYRIRPFDAFKQLAMFGDLQREVLPAIGGVLNVAIGSKGDDADSEAGDKAAIAAFRDLSTQFDGKTLLRWANLLLDEQYIIVEMEGRTPEKLDRHVRETALEDFADVLELMFHVGKVNFAAPLQRWASLSGLAQKLTARLPSESSGRTSPAS
jgi:hypothetical protein